MQLNDLDFSKYRFQDNDFEFVQTDRILKDKVPDSEPIGYFRDAFLRYRKNKAAMLATCIIGFIVLMAIIGPSINPYTYREQNVTWDSMPPRIPYLENFGIFDGSRVISIPVSSLETKYKESLIEVVKTYSLMANGREVEMAEARINIYKQKGAEDHYYWMGTDPLGRDQWTRIWRGTRVSLLMSLIAVGINLFIGVLYGSISAYYGKWVDLIMQRLVEILECIPDIPLLILFIVHFGAGMMPIVLALCLTGWIQMSIMIRVQFYRYKGQEYVMASRTMGAKDKRLIFRHILPNAIGPTITQVTMAIPTFIMTESILAYLGLGIQAPEPSIGVLLSEGQQRLLVNPHLTVFPAIIISLLMLSFNLMNNGLRDSFNPSLRGQE